MGGGIIISFVFFRLNFSKGTSMLGKILGALCAFMAIFMVGCSFFGGGDDESKPLYQPKQLDAQAKGITVAKSTPYNCKILGEVEGKDYATGKRGATKESIREGAVNDVRNQAAQVAGKGTRAMVAITKEVSECEVSVGFMPKTVSCSNIPSNATNPKPISYRISAQVYDCGK